MTQTIGAKSMRNAKIAYNTLGFGTSWVDFSGVLNSVEVSGGDRVTGEVFTADGDTPIVLFGKLNPIDVTGKIVYSEISTEAFNSLVPLYVAGTNLRLRWTPAGDGTGAYRFMTGTTNFTQFGYPGGEVGAGEPILVEFAVKTGTITYEVMTTATL